MSGPGDGMTDGPMAALRAALAGASCAADRLNVLGDLVERAEELLTEGGPEAVDARPGLDEALTHVAPLIESPDEDEYLPALYLRAWACMLRDAGSDLDDAIECLRELHEAVGGEPPDPADADVVADVEIRLGRALGERAGRPGGSAADVDEARRAIAAGLDLLAPDHPARPGLTAGLALECAVRYVAFDGSQDDRAEAMRRAVACLAAPGATAAEVACGHIVMAWMTLTRQFTTAQRSAMLTQNMETARRGGPKATALLAEFGTPMISEPDAHSALSHLREIPDGAIVGDDMKRTAAVLSSLALIAITGPGRPADEANGVAEDLGSVTDRVARELRGAAELHPADQPEHGELLGMRAALLAGRCYADGRPGSLDPVADAITEAVARLPEGHVIRPALLGQLGQALRQQATAAEGADDVAAEIERIMATLERAPRDDPGFAAHMVVVGVQLLDLWASHRTAIPADRLITLLEQANNRMAPDDPLKPIGESMYWAAIAVKAATGHEPPLMDSAIEGLMRCADRTPAGHLFRPYAVAGVAFALLDRYLMTGDFGPFERAGGYVQEAFDAIGAGGVAPGTDAAYARLLYLRGIMKLIAAESEGEDIGEAMSDVERAVELMPADDPARQRLAVQLGGVRAARGMRAPGAGPGRPLGSADREALDRMRAMAANLPRDHAEFPSLAAQAAAGLMARALADSDAKLMDEAISLLAEACSVPGLSYRERPRLLTAHGFALLTRHLATRDAHDLSYAIDRLEEARRAVEQELGSPFAAEVLQSLATAYRVRGDVDRAVTVGLAALREHAGDVLLQDNDDHALRAARRITSDAGEMGRWFLGHGRAEAAVQALELGRGTVLYAATAGIPLAEVLAESGHADLAAEWAAEMSRAAGTESGRASDLRYRIMRAIEGSAAEARLLSPPSVRQIGAALAECGADALVYLLPRGDDGPGVAVLVDADCGVRPLLLPGLYAGPGSPADACLRARRAADAAARDLAAGRPADGGAAEAWRHALGEQCDWAWRVAIGPVLDAVGARSRGSRRIVLVPGDSLGLVAWHAAREQAGGGYRYAAQEAVFSYASSARQFVEAARRQPRPWAQAPVLVSDARTSLYETAMGISYLRTAYYPAARVFGFARAVSDDPDPAPGADCATAADVLGALPHGDDPGASLLHFGCHGQAQVPVLSSWLDLGGDERVAVADILRRTRYRNRAASGGLVVLASCLTDVAEADYDEAVTLATAFLSTGTCGVVAARWSVAASHTGLFMAAFHRYLNGSYRHPAQALRSAQLWMLDPGRAVPPGLPTVLAEEVSPDLADPAAWAGFGYQGR
jgi:tetratricopeptide (TPR) repeat protein